MQPYFVLLFPVSAMSYLPGMPGTHVFSSIQLHNVLHVLLTTLTYFLQVKLYGSLFSHCAIIIFLHDISPIKLGTYNSKKNGFINLCIAGICGCWVIVEAG